MVKYTQTILPQQRNKRKSFEKESLKQHQSINQNVHQFTMTILITYIKEIIYS